MHSSRALTHLFLSLFTLFSILFLSFPSSLFILKLKAILFYCFSYGPLYGTRVGEHLRGIPSNISVILEQRELLREAEGRLQEARLLQSQAEKALSENRRLRELLGWRAESPWDVVVAQVLSRDLTGWFRSFLVDRGALDGMTLHQTVLGLRNGRVGLVGRVVEVSPRTSKVLLVSDELSSVSATVGSGEEQGLLEGDNGPLLWLRYLAGDAPVHIGDAVYTSNIGRVFPKHILIGRVAGIEPLDPVFGFRSARVEPAVRFSALNDVILLRQHP